MILISRARVSAPFELIRVKDLCRKVWISDASFFNYFEKKSDLIGYFIHLWALEMGWHAERLAARQGGLAAIEKIFSLTARKALEQQGFLAEIIAQQARTRGPATAIEITLAERLLAFPELEGIDGIRASGLHELLPPLLERAVAGGELPRTVDREAAMIAIASVFFGAPVTVSRAGLGELEPVIVNNCRSCGRACEAGRKEHIMDDTKTNDIPCVASVAETVPGWALLLGGLPQRSLSGSAGISAFLPGWRRFPFCSTCGPGGDGSPSSFCSLYCRSP